MCGRYALTANAQDIALQFGVDGLPEEFLPSDWNISPTKNIYFIKARDALGIERKLELGSWGLVPSWSKDRSRQASTINARLESVAEKPSFRSAFRSRRCLIPASGYYEWATEIGNFKLKQPFYIYRQDQELLPLAGIYEIWIDPNTGRELATASILTRQSTGQISKIHHRMPVFVPKKYWTTWLTAATLDKDKGVQYLNMLDFENPDTGLTFHPVSTLVNNARNNGPELISEVSVQVETLF